MSLCTITNKSPFTDYISLKEHDDYEAEQCELEVDDEHTPRPMHARSKLILGGVNPKRYEGCVFWCPTINDE